MRLLHRLFERNFEQLREGATRDMSRGKYTKAARKLEMATELNPDSPEIWLDLGKCYTHESIADAKAKGNSLPATDKVRAALERAIELGESGRGRLRDDPFCEACVTVGLSYQLQGDHERCVEYFKRGLRRTPWHTQLRLLLSGSYLLQGRVQDAEEIAAQLLESDRDNGRFLAHLREVRRRAGKPPVVDLPNNRRRKIYADFTQALGKRLKIGQETAEQLLDVGLSSRGGFDEGLARVDQALAGRHKRIRKEVTEEMLHKYGLKLYELILIELEGDEKGWR